MDSILDTRHFRKRGRVFMCIMFISSIIEYEHNAREYFPTSSRQIIITPYSAILQQLYIVC